jgi:dihydroflavonol-4-reductase
MLLSYIQDPWKSTWPGGVNLVHVEDVARAQLLVARRGSAGQRYLATGENMTWREVHSLISELAGLPGPYLTGNHTAAYLAALWAETRAQLSGERPHTTREQAKMVGNYYWYDAGPLHSLGWQPRPTRQALANALAGMLGKTWIPAQVRAEMELSDAVRAEKAIMGYEV